MAAPASALAQDSGECAGPVADGGASVNGFVVAGGGVPLPGAQVLVRWPAYAGGSAGELTAPTDESGRYSVCGLPTGVEIELVALALGRRGQLSPVSLEEGAELRKDLALGLTGGGGSDGGGSMTNVVGRVLAGQSGRPAAGATLRLEPGGREVTADSTGEFAMNGLEAGRYTIQVSHPEHGSRTDSIDLEGGGTTQALIRMGKLPKKLEPIKVTVRDPRLEQGGYYRRMERGMGYFITPQMLERRRPARLYQAFSMVPGVRIQRACENQRCARWPMMVGSNCFPMVYLNGDQYRIQMTEGLRNINPSSVAAIEVFRGPSEVPDVYSGSQAQCGVVAIWTK